MSRGGNICYLLARIIFHWPMRRLFICVLFVAVKHFFSHISSSRDGNVSLSDGRWPTLVQTNISQQLLDGLQQNLSQISAVPRTWILMTLMIPLAFHLVPVGQSFEPRLKYFDISIGLEEIFEQTFLAANGSVLVILVISWLFPDYHGFNWSPRNLVKTFMPPSKWTVVTLEIHQYILLHHQVRISFVTYLSLWANTHKMNIIPICPCCTLREVLNRNVWHANTQN